MWVCARVWLISGVTATWVLALVRVRVCECVANVRGHCYLKFRLELFLARQKIAPLLQLLSGLPQKETRGPEVGS